MSFTETRRTLKGQILGSEEFGIGSVKHEVLIERREEEEQGFGMGHVSRICVMWQW